MELLKDKVAIITGAASANGIGKKTADLFIKHGAHVVITDINEAACQQAQAEIGDEHLAIAMDVANKADCERVAEAVIQRFGKIDILVNNAGVTQPVKLLEITHSDYTRVTDVSLLGTLYMSQAVLPHMQANNQGSIVCMSSVSAQRGGGIFGGPHYSAAKAGVLGLAKAMAREFGGYHIRVNSIAPGLIQTDITQGKLSEQQKKDVIASIPLNRLGENTDVANACLFLASDLSSYITGSTIDVNGGMLIY